MTPWSCELLESVTHLVLENDISEILRKSRDSHNVYFSFHISIGRDQFVEGFRFVPDGRAELAGRKLALLMIGVGWLRSLEQLRPPLVLKFLPWGAAESTQPCHDGFQLVPHQ